MKNHEELLFELLLFDLFATAALCFKLNVVM